MTGSVNPTEAPGDKGFLAPKPDGRPVDHCFRCGVATAPGVGLCDEHNRGHISGPSSTQMHATIFGGIVLGVLAFFLINGGIFLFGQARPRGGSTAARAQWLWWLEVLYAGLLELQGKQRLAFG